VIRSHTVLLLAVLAGQTATWPLTGLHGPRTPFTKLPPSSRTIALKLLHPELGPLFQGESALTIEKAISTFPTDPLTLGTIHALAVQGNGEELCGAAGNCAFWVIDLQRHTVLLRATGVYGYTIDHTTAHTPPDIITRTQNSATESALTRWRYENAVYTPQTCATVDTADDSGAPYTQPKITPHTCGAEGN
jgi:hypothetical protein